MSESFENTKKKKEFLENTSWLLTSVLYSYRILDWARRTCFFYVVLNGSQFICFEKTSRYYCRQDLYLNTFMKVSYSFCSKYVSLPCKRNVFKYN